MKFAFFALALVASGVAASIQEVQPFSALAVLVGTSNDAGVTGIVRFLQDPDVTNTTEVTVSVNGINSGVSEVTFFVHQWGNISTATSAGGPYLNTSAVFGSYTVTNGSISDSRIVYNLHLFGSDSVVGRTIALHSSTNVSNSSNLAQAVIGIDVNSIADTKEVPAFRTACIFNGIGGVYGEATIEFHPTYDSSDVYARITGTKLNAGGHAIHIHEWADITGNLSGTGEHFNPFNATHGIPPLPRQAGDLGNIYFPEGTDPVTLAYKYINNTLLQLDNHFYLTQSFIGRTVVVHTQIDNCFTFGSRLTACVIGIADDSADYDFAAFDNVETDQNTTGCAVSTTGVQTTTTGQTTAVRTTAVQTTAVQTTAVQTTAVQTTAVQTTAVQTTAVQTTGVQTTAVQTTGANTTEGKTTGVQTTGVQTTSVQTTGVQTTDVKTTGVQTTGIQTTDVIKTTGVQTTDVQTTGIQTTDVIKTTGVQTTDIQSTGVQTTAVIQTTGVQTTGTAARSTGVQTTAVIQTTAVQTTATTTVSVTTGIPSINYTATTAILTGAPVSTTGSAATVAISIQLIVAAVCALFLY